MAGPFSPLLLARVREALENGEQAILFQNRRGFAPVVECHQCGWVPTCQHCDVSLTYHRQMNQLTCHYCGYTYRVPSGNGIDYSAERDDKGRYDVDDFIVENCTFQRFLGIPVNVYRGGSDESTAGPYVSIKGCVFDDCCNRQRGSVMRLIGPQLMTISDCSFKNSGLGGASIRLDEAIWEKICIRDCVFENSGRVMTSTDKVEQYNNVVR